MPTTRDTADPNAQGGPNSAVPLDGIELEGLDVRQCRYGGGLQIWPNCAHTLRIGISRERGGGTRRAGSARNVCLNTGPRARTLWLAVP